MTDQLKPPLSKISPEKIEATPAHNATTPGEVVAALMPQTSAGPEKEIDDAAKQAFLWKVHDYLGEYARFADTKAAFTGTLSAALLGTMYSADLFKPLISNWHPWILRDWLTLIAGVLLVIGITLTVFTVYPRLRAPKGQGFVFWGSLTAFKDLEVLRTSFHSQSARTLNDHLLSQNFTVAKFVCTAKYRNVSLSLVALLVGGLLAGGALLEKQTNPIGNSRPLYQQSGPPQ